MKNEQQLKQECIKTATFGCLIALIVTIFSKCVFILGGYGLGVIFAYLILLIDCKFANLILKSQTNRPKMMAMLLYFFKLGIYASGFLLAVKIPVIFNIIAVFIGYLNTKLTIYRLTLTRR